MKDIEKLYKQGEPIFIDELKSDGFTEEYALQHGMKKYTDDITGYTVYYFPIQLDIFGKHIEADVIQEDIITKKFLCSDTLEYGYYCGHYGTHIVHLTTQIPSTREIKSQHTDCELKIDLGSIKFVISPLDKDLSSEDLKYHQLLDCLETCKMYIEPEICVSEEIVRYCNFYKLDKEKLISLATDKYIDTVEDIKHALTSE
jgi:hypothetical protein